MFSRAQSADGVKFKTGELPRAWQLKPAFLVLLRRRHLGVKPERSGASRVLSLLPRSNGNR